MFVFFPEAGVGFFHAVGTGNGYGMGAYRCGDGCGHSDPMVVKAVDTAAGETGAPYGQRVLSSVSFAAQRPDHGNCGGDPVGFFQTQPLNFREYRAVGCSCRDGKNGNKVGNVGRGNGDLFLFEPGKQRCCSPVDMKGVFWFSIMTG